MHLTVVNKDIGGLTIKRDYEIQIKHWTGKWQQWHCIHQFNNIELSLVVVFSPFVVST